LHPTVGVIELKDHILRIDLCSDTVVDELDGVGDIGVRFRQEFGNLCSDKCPYGARKGEE